MNKIATLGPVQIDYIFHETQEYLDPDELPLATQEEFFQSLDILENSDATNEQYKSAIQIVARLAAWMSQNDIDRIPLKAFAQVVSQIKEFPLMGELGVFYLCYRKVKDRMELFFSTECRPLLVDSICWKALPPTIVQNFIKQTNDLSVINAMFSVSQAISRAPTVALVCDDNRHITKLFWHPGDISNQVTSSFKMECTNSNEVSYTPSFVIKAKAINDLVHISIALEQRNTVATLVLDSFNPHIQVDTHTLATSCSNQARSQISKFTQFDYIEGAIPRKLVNVAAPSITFTFSNDRQFHLLYSDSNNQGTVGIWGVATTESLTHLDHLKEMSKS